MTVEKTKWFKLELEVYVKFGRQFRFVEGRENFAREITAGTARRRGVDVTNKLISKANQQLKFNFYEKLV